MAVPRFWREIPNRYNLIGTKCGNCNKVFFPPRFICPQCRRMGKLEPYKLSRRGRIISYGVVHVAQEGFEDQVPYVLAIVELEDGPRLTTQVVDCDPNEVKIGDEVEMVFRRIGSDNEDGVIYYGFKFRKV
ncbi:MAG: Zn-ribbon domain-containing OB-fold protein [Candidatus Hadarchaeum sp.]|uniref:Zn-ribbon domain-containing OB-fold protein n=1 Tax=Candidatus Hadarchaeum sp. TaxID=2883567 RepID=UPI003D0BDB83